MNVDTVVRLARPTDRLDPVVRFYTQGLGLGILGSFVDHDGFDGVFEIVCGLALALGLLTRLSAIPMIIDMIVAILSTKIPLLLHDGFWKAAHEARLDFTMLLGSAFLLLAGAGPLSLDARLARRRED